MKKTYFLIVLACAIFIPKLHANKPITLTDAAGNSITIDMPDALADYMNQNINEINQILSDNGLTASAIQAAETAITNSFKVNGNKLTFDYIADGLNGFSKNLNQTLPNSQGNQNIWAESCISEKDKIHFGGGINFGVSSMSIKALSNAMEACDIDMRGIPNTFYFPTLNADMRLGCGFLVLPFDIGFTISAIDSSRINSVDNAIAPFSFDYFAIGTDVRVVIFEAENKAIPKISAGVGFNYTKGGVKLKDDTAFASLDFRTATFTFSAQASSKLLFFVPFIGTRISLSQSSVDWRLRAPLDTFMTNDGTLDPFIALGLLPEEFEMKGGASISFLKNIYPQIYGGFGLDFFFVNLTFSGGFDLHSKVYSGACNLRIAF